MGEQAQPVINVSLKDFDDLVRLRSWTSYGKNVIASSIETLTEAETTIRSLSEAVTETSPLIMRLRASRAALQAILERLP